MAAHRTGPIIGQRTLDDLGTPLSEVTFVVVDLETTGGNRNDDQITEIGAVKVTGGVVDGTFHTLVNPGRAIPPRITMLTGIGDAVVMDAPRLEQVIGAFHRFVGDAVFVAHNASFDLGFVRAAFANWDYPEYRPTIVDTAQLSRRLLVDEVPNHKLSTLADRLRLDHRPSHRALEDAKATVDLLHALLERAAGLGVTGLDDLVALSSMSGHPQAGKLALTGDLPRSPGVYLFRGTRDEVLYVGKATNLRQRVRSYFGREDRRRIAAMLRETRRIDHAVLPDPLTAEIVETRLIGRLLPRYNRVGTGPDRSCFLKIDTDSAWPRLSVVKRPTATGNYLGPIPSRKQALLTVEAIQSVVGLRRCTTRLGRSYLPPEDATPCSPCQLGVAPCPCAGVVDDAAYQRSVAAVVALFDGQVRPVVGMLTDRMSRLAFEQRFEEAAAVRDRIAALTGAVHRHQLLDAVRSLGTAEIALGDHRWRIEHGRLIDVGVDGRCVAALPVAAPDAVTDLGVPLPAEAVAEALCLARFLQRRAGSVEVVSLDGAWKFPVPDDARPERIDMEWLDVA